MTNKFVKIPASELGIGVTLVEGMESHGLFYFIRIEGDVLGAQCATCNTIIWYDSRKDPILAETHPASVPCGGSEYKQYYLEKLGRFLSSLPACPTCSMETYDLMVTNVIPARFSDGTPIDLCKTDVPLNENLIDDINVWWLQR